MTAAVYASAAEIRAQTTIPSSQDTSLTTLATTASRLIDRYCKRQPGAFAVSADETRYFDGSGTLEQWVDELAAAPTSVSVAETLDTVNSALSGGTYTLWSTDEYFLWPSNAAAMGRPFTRLDIDLLNGSKAVWYRYRNSVKVVGKFGFAVTTPEDIKQATIITATRWFSRGQQGFRDTGANAEMGQLFFTKALDPDVQMILDQAGLRRTVL